MRDHAALELERRVGGIVGVGLVGLAVLVDAARNVRRAEAAHRLHVAEQVVEHVAPVAQHIEDDAAALGLLVVPARTLRRLAPVALEHPVAELAAHGEHAAEEAGIAQHRDLAQARQGQLVLHDAVLDAFLLGELRKRDSLVERVRDRLFAIDVLAGVDRLRDEVGAHLRGRGIEEDRVVRVLQRGRKIRGGARDAVLLAKRRDLLGVAADQDRVRHHAIAVRQRDAALLADRQDRAHEVLVQPHASGDAVHDDAEIACRHAGPPACLLANLATGVAPERQVRSLMPSRVRRAAFCRFTASGGMRPATRSPTCRTVSNA